MVTGDDGKFQFTGLVAGKYSLNGAGRGFISADYDQHDQYSTAIVTGAGVDTEHLLLRLAPDAVIEGKILDESNEPVRHAVVTLYYDAHSNGVDEIRQSRSAQTNDLGEYEMTPLRPGTYFLSVSAQPWYAIHPPAQSGSDSNRRAEVPSQVDRSLDVSYPVTYYPEATEADEAMAIPIQGGERIQADIHLTPTPSLHLLVRVPSMGESRYSFPTLEQPAFDGFTTVRSSGPRQISPGLFELTGVPAGRYNIRFVGPAQAHLQLSGVDLAKDGEEIDGTKSEAAGSVKFSVQVSGRTLPQHLYVGLRTGNGMIAASSEVDPKGEAELSPVSAGQYEIAAWGSSARYSIARVTAQGATVSGHSLNLAAGANASVDLTLIAGKTAVEGKVTRAGKGFAGAMVVLVPTKPELDRDLFRRDQSDLDGTFVLRDVVPGSYTLLAIDNGWDLDWSQPGVIGAYTKRGRKIQVGDDSEHPMNAEAVEVQSK